MARPQRNNVDYFPFYCDDGKKMFYIEETYGNDGFATFVKLLRELGKTDYHYLNLSDKTTVMFLSAKCKVSKETLLNIINDLVDLGKFDAKLWNENSIIWCQDFIDSIQDAYNKRSNECISYDSLIELLIGLGVRKRVKSKSKGDVNPQSIVDETILNESKEDEDPILSEWDILFNEWFDYKKEKKQTYKSEKSMDAFKKSLKKLSKDNIEDAKKIIEFSMSNNYSGIFELKPDTSKSITSKGINYDTDYD